MVLNQMLIEFFKLKFVINLLIAQPTKKSIQIFSNQQFLIRYHIKQKRATFWSLFSFGIKDYLSSKEINFF